MSEKPLYFRYVEKRDGSRVGFDYDKITSAVERAFAETGEAHNSKKVFKQLKKNIEQHCLDVYPVETIQDIVETTLMEMKYTETAKAYIRYRYLHELERQKKNDNEFLSMLRGSNEYWQGENSNKNPKLVTVQRDYLAGIASTDIARNYIFPKEVVEAHDTGICHQHDMDYMAQETLHNCFSRNTYFITKDGLKSFNDFNDGDTVEVLSIDGAYHSAVVHSYGEQSLYEYDFYCGKKEHVHTVRATENHRWILHDGSETTNLKIGDKLIKAPVVYQQNLDWDALPDKAKLAWCKGFGIGDGAVEGHSSRTRIRLCGEKNNQYLNRFKINGCSIRNTHYPDSSDKEVVIYNYSKEIPKFDNILELQCFLNGLYCADGSMQGTSTGRINYRLQSSNRNVIDFIHKYADSCGLYITKERDITGEITNFGERPYTIYFSFNPDFYFNYKVADKRFYGVEEVWCLEVEDTHNFILQYGIPTGNCCLINLEDMLQNGTVINNVKINKPHRLSTAMTITTQVMASVAANQYGGETITLTHIAPFVRDSYNAYRDKYRAYGFDEQLVEDLARQDLKKEIEDAVQTFNYQISTLFTLNGQAPFCSVMMYLNETEEYKPELIMLIEEFLRQRVEGMPNRHGIKVTQAFPKILYVLQEDNYKPGTEYWWLTQKAIDCSARRLTPDYISEKVMKEIKVDDNGDGQCFPCIN